MHVVHLVQIGFKAPLGGRGVGRRSLSAWEPGAALGGEHSVGEGLAHTMILVATDMRVVKVRGAGHFVLEESPAEVAAAMLAFVHTARPLQRTHLHD